MYKISSAKSPDSSCAKSPDFELI